MGVDVKLGTNPKIHLHAGAGARPYLHIAYRRHGHRRLLVAGGLRQAKSSKEKHGRRHSSRALRHGASFGGGAKAFPADARLVWGAPELWLLARIFLMSFSISPRLNSPAALSTMTPSRSMQKVVGRYCTSP